MRKYLPLAGLCLAVFLAMSGMGMAGVALPAKYLQLAGTLEAAGWLSALFAFAYCCFQYPFGLIADRYGFRYVLAMGFLLMAFSAIIYEQSQTTWGIYLGRMLQGGGEAPVWAAAPAYLSKAYPNARGRAIGWYNAVFHLGMMTGPLLALQPWGIGTPDPFETFRWLCIAAMILVLCCIRESGQGQTAAIHKPAATQIRSALWPLVLGVCVFGAFYGLSTSSIPVYLAVASGGTQKSVGLFYLSLFSGITLAQYVAGCLSDRHGRVPFMGGGMLISGLALLGLILITATVFPVFFFGYGVGTWNVFCFLAGFFQ